MCGGTSQPSAAVTVMVGLSPRVRGNLPSASARSAVNRSIPACAGEPLESTALRLGIGVYPRVCGGTGLIHRTSLSLLGLSPRVRGNRGLHHDSKLGRGSIPACAGEPGKAKGDGTGLAVYPRVCGGTHTGGSARRAGEGLSPRVRGNRVQAAIDTVKLGSIPACAGEPQASLGQTHHPTVYPRVCGGTCPWTFMRPTRAGLSPRVRGNLTRTLRPSIRTRSIPACAGEPVGVHTR